MNISEPFIRRPVATSLLMMALGAVGIAAFPLLPVAPLPQVDFPTIQVAAQFPGPVPKPWRRPWRSRWSASSRRLPASPI
jgi:multidrug efflux pump subunit AcrB